MDKNLLERLNKLALALADAEHTGDEEKAEDLRDEIWILEDEISEEAEFSSSTNSKHWN